MNRVLIRFFMKKLNIFQKVHFPKFEYFPPQHCIFCSGRDLYIEDEWDMTESIKYYKMEIDCEYAETMQNYAGILYKEIGVDRSITKRQVMAQHLLI